MKGSSSQLGLAIQAGSTSPFAHQVPTHLGINVAVSDRTGRASQVCAGGQQGGDPGAGGRRAAFGHNGRCRSGPRGAPSLPWPAACWRPIPSRPTTGNVSPTWPGWTSTALTIRTRSTTPWAPRPRATARRTQCSHRHPAEQAGTSRRPWLTRDAAITALLLYTGAQAEERARLDTEDIAITARTEQIRLHGKGDQVRTVPLLAPRAGAHQRVAAQAWGGTRPLAAGSAWQANHFWHHPSRFRRWRRRRHPRPSATSAQAQLRNQAAPRRCRHRPGPSTT